jgi:acetyl esterase
LILEHASVRMCKLKQFQPMRYSVIFFFIAAMALSGASLDETNVEYANRAGKPLLLDLHVPEGSGPFPAAILIHGGGFDAGHKDTNVKPLFEPLSNGDFAWFSIDYRLAPEAKFPDVNQDINDAIAWVRSSVNPRADCS